MLDCQVIGSQPDIADKFIAIVNDIFNQIATGIALGLDWEIV